MANQVLTKDYSSSNVGTSAYVKLGSPTTVPVNKILVSDSSGQLVKLAVDTGSPIAAVSSTLVNQTITYTSRLPGAEGNTITMKLTDPGSASQPLAVSVVGEDINANLQSSAPVAATASLATTVPIVLTSVAAGTARNTQTFKTVVAAAAANPTNTILVAFTGTAAAIVCTITPNDGTNNGAVPVNLTTAQLRELITTGAVVGKTITLTDGSSLRALQTATGGGPQNLVAGGEGDNVTATFSGGLAYTLITTAAQLAAAISASGAANGLVSTSVGTPGQVLVVLAKTALSGGSNAAQNIVDLFQLPVDQQLIIPLPSLAAVPVGSQLYLKAISGTASSGFNVTTLLS